MESKTISNRVTLSDEQLLNLRTKKIFFGHQSVGDNIVQGIEDLKAEDSRLQLNVVNSRHPEQVAEPALVESHIGHNEDPQSKNEAFAAIVQSGMGSQGGIAMYKYCYIDFNSSTNVQQMFEAYRQEIAMLRSKYPLLKIVHITAPLTTVEPATKAWLKAKLGRTSSWDTNAKRNEFNNLLKQTYAATDPIVDLAEVESTHPDGSRSYVMRENKRIYTLAPEFTEDGGHLNKVGRRAAAEQLLLVLSTL